MTSTSSVSIVVPVYNAERTLDPLVERIDRTLSARGGAFEIVLVNDGSRDASWDVIRRIATQRSFVRGIDLMRNYGQHNALLAGVRAARNEIVVTIDDDLQNPPEEIPKLLDRLGTEYDVVYGTPPVRRHGFWRNVASALLRLCLRSVTTPEVAQIVTGFRAFRTDLRKAFEGYESAFIFLDALLPWATSRYAAVEVRHDARSVGTSNYGFLRLLGLGIDMLTSFSTLPLRFASFVGFAFTAFGGVVLVATVIRYFLFGYALPGFAFLVSSISLFAGAQLFALGIMGEYLARVHFRSMGRPSSVVRQSVEIDRSPQRRAGGGGA
ncbi:MAG: glycosyltransferase family 2 protein [Deltaproteobacteria bacterium]|nr:glycosyltransferase family 2 protein [Deltaproteobacteria bacterium]